MQSSSAPVNAPPEAALISDTLTFAKVYPNGVPVGTTEVTEPLEIVTVQVPLAPSPLIGILVNVPAVPPVPGVLILIISIEPSLAFVVVVLFV
jgi:hypothetical protein